MRGLMGSLQVFSLPDLVELLSRRRVSGELTCERGTIRKTAYLVEGAVVGAASNDPREFLGQFLVNFGHVTEEQLARAFHTQGESKARLGQILVSQGAVKPEVIRDVLAIKIRETLLDVYLWDAGLFQLDTEGAYETDELGTRVELAEIGREAEFRTTAWTAFRAAFPSGAATLVVHGEKVPRDLVAATVDGRLLSLAKQGRTVDELALDLHMPDFHLYQRLFALQKRGILDAAPLSDAGAIGVAELVERARAFLADGRPEDAESVARRVLELSPGHEVARAALVEAERALTASLEALLVDKALTPRSLLRLAELAKLDGSAVDKYVLSRCDGTRTVRQLVQTLPLRRLEVLRTIHRYAEAGTVTLFGMP
jgi:hypothetical protein